MEKLWENAQVTISGSGFFDLVVETQIKKQQWEEYLKAIKIDCESDEPYSIWITHGPPLPLYERLAEYIGDLASEDMATMDVMYNEGLVYYTPHQSSLDSYNWDRAIDLREVSEKFKDAWMEASKREKALRDELRPKDKHIDPDYTTDIGG